MNMQRFQVIRDPRESWARCSLAPLRKHPNIHFQIFDPMRFYHAEGMILLDHEGAPLSKKDANRPILLLDSSWRRLPGLKSRVCGNYFPRSIPLGFRTANPRKSTLYSDPTNGLGSNEALFIASLIVGYPDQSLLDGYYWKEKFLALNQQLFNQ